MQWWPSEWRHFFAGLLLNRLNTFTLRLLKIPRACIHMMSNSKTFKTKRSKMLLSPWLVDASCNPFENLTNYLPLGDFFQRTRQTCDIQLSFQCTEGKLHRTNQSKKKRKKIRTLRTNMSFYISSMWFLVQSFARQRWLTRMILIQQINTAHMVFNLWAFLQSTCRILTARWISESTVYNVLKI